MPANNNFFHIHNEAVHGTSIFRDEADKITFLSFLKEYLSPTGSESVKKTFTVKGREYQGVPHMPKNYHTQVELIAYSLKPDGFNLILEQKVDHAIERLIRSLATRYSIYFNKKYNRTGTIFSGPYKSSQIKDQAGLDKLKEEFKINNSHGEPAKPHEYVAREIRIPETPLIRVAQPKTKREHRVPEYLFMTLIFFVLVAVSITRIKASEQIQPQTTAVLSESTVATPEPLLMTEPTPTPPR